MATTLLGEGLVNELFDVVDGSVMQHGGFGDEVTFPAAFYDYFTLETVN